MNISKTQKIPFTVAKSQNKHVKENKSVGFKHKKKLKY